MSKAATVVDLPATPEQLRRAREIIERVCAELGIAGEIDVERYQDPEIPEPPSALFNIRLYVPMPYELISELSLKVVRALSSEHLHTPFAPIMAVPWPEWTE